MGNEGTPISFGSMSGTKIGGTTTQKIGFFGSTPIPVEEMWANIAALLKIAEAAKAASVQWNLECMDQSVMGLQDTMDAVDAALRDWESL